MDRFSEHCVGVICSMNLYKKNKAKTSDLNTLSMATAPEMENDERADPDGSADIPVHATSSHSS